MSNDTCTTPTDILPEQDIADKASELAKKTGADQICTQDSLFAEAHASVSGQTSGFGLSAGGQVSGGTTFDQTHQSGCGSLVISAQNIINQTKKIQCIIQKNTREASTSVSNSLLIDMTTQPLSPQEQADKAAAIADYISKPSKPLSDAVILAYINKGITPPDPQQDWNDGLKIIKDTYSRDIVLNNVSAKQTITGKIQIISQLNSSDQASIDESTKLIADSVASTALSTKAGVNALTPLSKSVTSTSTQQTSNTSNTTINEKITRINNDIQNKAVIKLGGYGSINANNITFDQNIAVDIITQSIIGDAISAGLKSVTDILSKSDIKSTIVIESAGVDAAIKAQGEANAAAIKASGEATAAAGSAGTGILIVGFCVLVLFIVYLIITKVNPYIGILIMFCIIGGSIVAAVYIYRMLLPPPLGTLLNRPLSVYQKLWKAIGCSSTLTQDDVLEWDKITDDSLVRQKMQEKYNNIKNGTDIDITVCFKDGIIPKPTIK